MADARAVDARTTPYVDSLSWASFLRLVDAEIIAVDPAAAEECRRARELGQFVSAGQSDEHGLKTLIARAEAGEVIVFLAMVSRIADILQLEGDTAPVGCRRARAIGSWPSPRGRCGCCRSGPPSRCTPAITPAAPPTGPPPPADDPTSDHGQVVEETVSGTEPEPDAQAEPTPRPEEGCCPTCGEDIPAWAYEQAPGRTTAQPFPVDPDKVRPKAVLHLRMAAEALRAGTGVAVLVNQGASPITVGEAIRLLGHCQVSVRPVLDLRDQLPVDAYEIPAAMREAVHLSRPGSVFPWTTGRGRTDLDHTRPYLPPDRGGPPGQTAVDNLGPLDRFGHRVKTHAHGWRHHQPAPGVYRWRTPHGYWVQVDQHGTHHLGRDPDLVDPRRDHLRLVDPDSNAT